jgi:hypothetical protein
MNEIQKFCVDENFFNAKLDNNAESFTIGIYPKEV